MTLVGAVLAAIKGIATNRILVGRLKFHPLDLLLRMSRAWTLCFIPGNVCITKLTNYPFVALAFAQCLIFSYMSGELSQVYDRTFVSCTLGQVQWLSLLVNGSLAFGLNVVSFTVSPLDFICAPKGRKASSLTCLLGWEG